MGSVTVSESLSTRRGKAPIMQPYVRDLLLSRVDRDGATVGVKIPETLTIDDTAVSLRDRVVTYQAKTKLREEEKRGLHDFVVSLRRARKDRRDRIQHEQDLDRQSAEILVDEIIGIDRALAGLTAVGEDTDIEEQIQNQRVADTQRWQHFLKNARVTELDRSLKR